MMKKSELPKDFREKLDNILHSYSPDEKWTGLCASTTNDERRNYTFTSADGSYYIFVLTDRDYNILEARKMVPFDTNERLVSHEERPLDKQTTVRGEVR